MRYFVHKDDDYPCWWVLDNKKITAKSKSKVPYGFSTTFTFDFTKGWQEVIKNGLLIEVSEAELVLII